MLTQGSYRINPYAYASELVPAVEIRVDQVGVQSLKVGKDPSDLPVDPQRGSYVVPAGYRGIQEQTVPPGTYYINPYAEVIVPVEVRSHKAELTDIEFPSRDGFLLQPRVVVEYAVQAAKAPEMLVRLTDEGILHQRDETPAGEGRKRSFAESDSALHSRLRPDRREQFRRPRFHPQCGRQRRAAAGQRPRSVAAGAAEAGQTARAWNWAWRFGP